MAPQVHPDQDTDEEEVDVLRRGKSWIDPIEKMPEHFAPVKLPSTALSMKVIGTNGSVVNSFSNDDDPEEEEETPCCILHPASPMRVKWDMMQCIILVYVAFCVPYQVALDVPAYGCVPCSSGAYARLV